MPAFLAFAAVALGAQLVATALTPLPPTIGKLDNLNLPRSELGTPIPVVFGFQRILGNMHYSTDLKQKIKKGSSGFIGLGKTPDEVKYSYVDCSFLFCEGEIEGIESLFADGVKMWTIGENQQSSTRYRWFVQVFKGKALEDRLVIDWHNDTSASYNESRYNYIAKAAIRRFKISEFGNRIPAVEAVIQGFDFNLEQIIGRVVDELDIGISGRDLANLAGITPHGCYWGRDGDTAGDFLQDLAMMYNFTLFVDSNNILRAVINDSKEAPRIIADNDLHVKEIDSQYDSGIRLRSTPIQELPSAIKLNFNNTNRDYEVGSVTVEKSDVEHRNIVTMDTVVAMNDSEAATIATRILNGYYHQRHTYTNISLPLAYLDIEIGTKVLFNYHNQRVLARITKKDIGTNGQLLFEAVSIVDDIDSQQVTLNAQYDIQETSVLGSYRAIPLDLPWLQESNLIQKNSTQLIAQASRDLSGNNVTLGQSDVAIDYLDGDGLLDRATLNTIELVGTTNKVIQDNDYLFLTDETLEMTLEGDTSGLRVDTTGVIINGKELIYFGGVEDLPGQTWRFNQIIRGVFGTNLEVARIPIGTNLRVLYTDNYAVTEHNTSILNRNLEYLIEEDDDTVEDNIVVAKYEGECLEPLPVTQIEGTRMKNGDLKLTWQSRARYNNHGFDAVYEDTETWIRYRLRIAGLTGEFDHPTNSYTITSNTLQGNGFTNRSGVFVTIRRLGKIPGKERTIRVVAQNREL